MVQSILAYAVGTFVALFPIANPIGAVPIFYSLTETDMITFYDNYLKKEVYKKEVSLHSIFLNAIEMLPKKVYISFDIDSLVPSLCPNTGTPVPSGLEFQEAMFLIKLVVDSGRTIIGFDLSEVAGVGHDWDGNVGARVLYKLSNYMGKSNNL